MRKKKEKRTLKRTRVRTLILFKAPVCDKAVSLISSESSVKSFSQHQLILSKKDMHAWVSFVRKFMNEYTNLRVIENRENSNNLKVINPGYTLSTQKVV